MAITASIIGASFITVMMDGTTHTVNSDHTNYARIREALKAKDHQLVERLINVKQSVVSFGQGKVTVQGGTVFYNDNPIKGSVVSRILQMISEGFDAQPMMNFLANLMANPSKRAVDELYGFLEATSLPITEDGCFLAYKKVRDDWKDFYTGTITHKLANLMTQAELAEFPKTFGNVTVSVEGGNTVLSMPRNEVDDERDRTCSYGLHFCSLGYLPHYHGGDGRVVIVKINPADVVSIPTDYNNAKGRACRYAIASEHASDDRERQEYFTAPVYSANAGHVAPAAPASAPTASAAASPSNGPSPALSGYNRGRSDAANGRAHDPFDVRFTGEDARRYAEAYNKGFNSVGKVSGAAQQETDDEAYDRGYEDGCKRGEDDALTRSAFDATPPAGENENYIAGYNDGYADNYSVDWEDVAYDRAGEDVAANRPYDDAPPASCDDMAEYREGYANGWRDAKIARI